MTDDSQTVKGQGASLVLVTGASGAGRTTALRVLEDLGFEVIDNLPLSLVPRLLSGPLDHPLALGIDTRNREFSTAAVIDLIDRVQGRGTHQGELMFLDCRADVLVRRFSETRRRHPLAPNGTPAEGIERELDLLSPIRARADLLIDTSDLSPHDLKEEITRWYAPEGGGTGLAVSVQSFSYKRGAPRGLDLVFDVRFLKNPHWDPALRPRDGRDPEVARYIETDPRFAEFAERVQGLIAFLLPAYRDEGKTHLAIGFGCTGGRHRSVALTESLAKTLAEAGWQVSIRHRELERQDANGVPARQEKG